MKSARLSVRYGKHREGEMIRGELAEKLVDMGMAKALPDDEPKKKAAPKKKSMGAAPENKEFNIDE